MSKRGLALLTFAVLMPARAFAQDVQTAIGNATKVMGELRTVEYSATGFDFVLGQNYSGDAPWPKFISKTYTRSIDFQTPSSRVDRIRMQGENPPRGGSIQTTRTSGA